MVAHPLLGPWIKVRRAQTHLDSLYGQYLAYATLEPIKPWRQYDPAIGKRRFGFYIDPPVPNSIALTIGDVAHNLVSALDHLVGQLVIANGRRATRDEAFPIYVRHMTKAEFRKLTKSRIGNCSTAAQDLIEELQPYHKGDDARKDLLWIIKELDRLDKHQRINIVGGSYRMAIKSGTTGFSIAGIDLGPIISGEERGVFGDFVEIGTLDEHGQPEGGLEPYAEFNLAFGDNEGPCPRESVEIVQTALEHVRTKVLPRFAALFSEPFDGIAFWEPEMLPEKEG